MARVQEELKREGVDVDVRFLVMMPTKMLAKEGRTSDADAKGTLDKIKSVLKRADVIGVDVAGPEKYEFGEEGMQNFVAAYEAVKAAAKARGRPLVFRPHVGEGYAEKPLEGKAAEPEGKSHKDVAHHNLDMLLDALEKLGYSADKADVDKGDGVIVRFGHATHADAAQVMRMKRLGVIAEANIGSNVQTGSIAPDMSEHPLLLQLYHEVPTILSTDAQGVMQTGMADEYARARKIIDDFRAPGSRVTIEVDGVRKRFDELTPKEQARFDVAKLEAWAKAYGEDVARGDTKDAARPGTPKP
jgi:hypothetical protein